VLKLISAVDIPRVPAVASVPDVSSTLTAYDIPFAIGNFNMSPAPLLLASLLVLVSPLLLVYLLLLIFLLLLAILLLLLSLFLL
jgi:hypothetical protein